MFKITLFLVVFVCISYVASMRGIILGPGRWYCMNIVLCDEPEQYEMQFNVSRKKLNRTHDCFDLHMNLHREVNNTYAMKIDAYQLVDGGFKYFQSFEDSCACKFLMKNAGVNVRRALASANVDPPDCPIKPGPILINKFVMDYRELPKHGVYGTFLAIITFTYDAATVGCVKCIVNFDERNDDDSDEQDDGLPDLRLL